MVPGELVAIIGPSGAGKSTLLKSLCGVSLPTAGRVTINGEPVQARVTDLGYVPQHEIVHPLLTVREALDYAAELRLPQDTRREDREAAVTRVLDEVGLVAHADTMIANVSGGQRKRAGVATELINQPGLLFLDEPTTGLDPGLEVRLMTLFRKLAEAGRATMVVTHATRSLRLCDKVVVMGEGGYLCFCGTPDDAITFFGVEHFDDLYVAIEDRGSETWAQQFQRTIHRRLEVRTPPPTARRLQPTRPLAPQAQTLVRRRLKILARDRRNLWILGLQVPILALLLALLFNRAVFVHGAGIPMTAGLSAQLLFLLVTVALWFGSLASHARSSANGLSSNGNSRRRSDSGLPAVEGDRPLRPDGSPDLRANADRAGAEAASRVPLDHAADPCNPPAHDVGRRRYGPARFGVG